MTRIIDPTAFATGGPTLLGGEVAIWSPSRDDVGNGTATLYDLFGSNNGTLTNMDPATDWPADTGAGGVRAVEFDGAGTQHVLVPNHSSLEPTSAMSVVAWVNITAPGTWPGQDNIADYPLAKGERGALPFVSYGLRYIPNTDVWSYVISTSSGGFLSIDGTSTHAHPTGWHCVCGTYDGSNATLYVDGAEEAVAAKTGTISYALTTNDLQLGRWRPGNHNRAINGRIDNIRIYNRALSAAEVSALYDGGNGRSF